MACWCSCSHVKSILRKLFQPLLSTSMLLYNLFLHSFPSLFTLLLLSTGVCKQCITALPGSAYCSSCRSGNLVTPSLLLLVFFSIYILFLFPLSTSLPSFPRWPVCKLLKGPVMSNQGTFLPFLLALSPSKVTSRQSYCELPLPFSFSVITSFLTPYVLFILFCPSHLLYAIICNTKSP